MITTIVHTGINTTTWHEFHSRQNDNSMEKITDRAIGYFDLGAKLRNFHPVLHELCHSIQNAIEESIKRKYN